MKETEKLFYSRAWLARRIWGPWARLREDRLVKFVLACRSVQSADPRIELAIRHLVAGGRRNTLQSVIAQAGLKEVHDARAWRLQAAATAALRQVLQAEDFCTDLRQEPMPEGWMTTSQFANWLGVIRSGWVATVLSALERGTYPGVGYGRAVELMDHLPPVGPRGPVWTKAIREAWLAWWLASPKYAEGGDESDEMEVLDDETED